MKSIAEHYKMKRPTVSNVIRRYKNNTVGNKKKMGRKPKLSERGMRLLKKYVLQNCFEPLYVITARFNAATKLQLSINTTRRYIKKLKMYSYVAIQKPFLRKKNISARIKWAMMHKNWTLNQWSKVAFTDEASFTVRPMRNRLKVWRHRGKGMLPNNIVPTFKSGYQTISVWGCFSMHGRTPPVGTIGSFTSATYRVIIDNHIIPFIYDIHGGTNEFILQEDNCGPHRAKNIATYLANEDVARMEWPPQSPDLNPIENVWGLMKNRLRKRSVHPSSPMHLFSILSEMWNTLPDSYFQSLVASMPVRVKKVRQGRGKSTKY